MLKLISLSFAFIHLNLFADTTGVCEDCQKSCSQAEELAMTDLEFQATLLMRNFDLSPNRNGPDFPKQVKMRLDELNASRKGFSEKCFAQYCRFNQKVSVRKFELNLDNGLRIDMIHPACLESSPAMPIRLPTWNYMVGDVNVLDGMYSSTSQFFSLSVKPSIKTCKDTAGGKFELATNISEKGISVAPRNETTPFTNPSSGAQAIYKKKQIPSVTKDSQGNFLLGLGGNYKISISKDGANVLSENITTNACVADAFRSRHKDGTPTYYAKLRPSSLNANGLQVFSTLQYKEIESIQNKLGW